MKRHLEALKAVVEGLESSTINDRDRYIEAVIDPVLRGAMQELANEFYKALIFGQSIDQLCEYQREFSSIIRASGKDPIYVWNVVTVAVLQCVDQSPADPFVGRDLVLQNLNEILSQTHRMNARGYRIAADIIKNKYPEAQIFEYSAPSNKFFDLLGDYIRASHADDRQKIFSKMVAFKDRFSSVAFCDRNIHSWPIYNYQVEERLVGLVMRTYLESDALDREAVHELLGAFGTQIQNPLLTNIPHKSGINQQKICDLLEVTLDLGVTRPEHFASLNKRDLDSPEIRSVVARINTESFNKGAEERRALIESGNVSQVIEGLAIDFVGKQSQKKDMQAFEKSTPLYMRALLELNGKQFSDYQSRVQASREGGTSSWIKAF